MRCPTRQPSDRRGRYGRTPLPSLWLFFHPTLERDEPGLIHTSTSLRLCSGYTVVRQAAHRYEHHRCRSDGA